MKPRDVKRAAILGAGTMGGGIATSFANAGIPVTLIEQSEEALKRWHRHDHEELQCERDPRRRIRRMM